MGKLHLAFNYYSFLIDAELQTDIAKDNIVDASQFIAKVSQFEHVCYKIANYKSLLEKVFEFDEDKPKLQQATGANLVNNVASKLSNMFA
jgi:hypothetical protein